MATFLYVGCITLCLLPWAFPTTLKLEKAQPVEMDMSKLRHRDQLRHQQIGVLNFTLSGSVDLYSYGYYFTKVKMGSPPQESSLLIDTGSDLSWVSCVSSNKIGMPLRLYDPDSSSSSSQIYCSSKDCPASAAWDIGSSCHSPSSKCGYQMQYGDGTTVSGYLRSDVLHFNTTVPGSPTFSTSVIFGCNYHRSGRLAESDVKVNGLLGLGHGFFSLPSQLSAVGIAPLFAHCLVGEKSGGGYLVFGEIIDLTLVYTPLIPAGSLYYVNLQSIAMNGRIVDIDPVVFTLKDGMGGTVVDSGTTLAILTQDAYDPFVRSLTAAVSQFARPVETEAGLCFQVSGRIDDIFPLVSFNFEGGASMVVKPKDYLSRQLDSDGSELWCSGFQKQEGDPITVLGDIVLVEKIIVYDLVHQRLGWTDHNCSKPVNISAADEYVNIHESSGSSTVISVLASTAAFFVYIVFFGH